MWFVFFATALIWNIADHFQMFGGGPLSPPIGEYLVSRGVRLRAIYGTTEVGAVCDVCFDPKDDEDWCWITWAKETNIRWVAQGDGKSELQFLVGISYCNSEYRA